MLLPGQTLCPALLRDVSAAFQTADGPSVNRVASRHGEGRPAAAFRRARGPREPRLRSAGLRLFAARALRTGPTPPPSWEPSRGFLHTQAATPNPHVTQQRPHPQRRPPPPRPPPRRPAGFLLDGLVPVPRTSHAPYPRSDVGVVSPGQPSPDPHPSGLTSTQSRLRGGPRRLPREACSLAPPSSSFRLSRASLLPKAA